MADKTVRYTPEFRRQVVVSARSGRTAAASLSKEFGPSAMPIGTWIKQSARDAGKDNGGLSSAGEELTRLRRENRRLKEQREILSRAAAWFATENDPSKRSSGS